MAYQTKPIQLSQMRRLHPPGGRLPSGANPAQALRNILTLTATLPLLILTAFLLFVQSLLMGRCGSRNPLHLRVPEQADLRDSRHEPWQPAENPHAGADPHLADRGCHVRIYEEALNTLLRRASSPITSAGWHPGHPYPNPGIPSGRRVPPGTSSTCCCSLSGPFPFCSPFRSTSSMPISMRGPLFGALLRRPACRSSWIIRGV